MLVKSVNEVCILNRDGKVVARIETNGSYKIRLSNSEGNICERVNSVYQLIARSQGLI